MAGQYQVAVEADGYEMAIKSVNISRRAMLERRPLLVNFQLRPVAEEGPQQQPMVVTPDEEEEAEAQPVEGPLGEETEGWGDLSPEQVHQA